MKNCKYCKTEIKDKEAICANCKKKQGDKIFNLLLIGIIALFALFTFASCAANKTEIPTATDTTTDNFTTAELTYENIKNAITDPTVKRKVIEAEVDNGTVTVVVYDPNISDLKTYLQENQQKSAGVFNDLFKNKGVSTVIYQAKIALPGVYGSINMVTAQTNTMTRENADQVSNWNDFANEPMSQFYNVVNSELAPDSLIKGISSAWAEVND